MKFKGRRINDPYRNGGEGGILAVVKPYVTVQGFTDTGPPGTRHTPWAYDAIDGISGGGWAAGPSVCANCQAYVQTGMTVSLTIDPALTFLEHVDGQVFCTSLNGYLWESSLEGITLEEAITYSKNIGGSPGNWQVDD